MKKILITASLFLASVGFAMAQQTPTKTTTKTSVKKEATVAKAADKKADKKELKAEKKEMKATTTAKTNNTGLKKDGTPDMRMKQNKVTAKTSVAGPNKKDGTADMRYKANKKK